MKDVSLREEGDTLHVGGDLTFATVGKVARDSQWRHASRVVDLAGVNACDSAGLALLIEWLRQARRAGTAIVYRNVPERMLQLARISELDGIITADA